MLFQRWVQMGFSSPEVSCGGCELTRLWMLYRVDPRGLIGLSGLGSRQTHPRKLCLLQQAVRGPRPYRFGSDNRGCSRTNAWQFSTFPQRRLPAFFSKASTCVHTGIHSILYLGHHVTCWRLHMVHHHVSFEVGFTPIESTFESFKRVFQCEHV